MKKKSSRARFLAGEWLTLDDAAARAGVSTRTVRRRIAAGEVLTRRGADARRKYIHVIDLQHLIPGSSRGLGTQGGTK